MAQKSKTNDVASARPAPADGEGSLEQMRTTLRGLSECMLITLPSAADASGLHGRPMYMAKVDDACGVWFLTAIDSGKVEEVERESQAYIVAQGGARQVMMEGRAEVLEDSKIIDELWNPGAEMWFDGREDPRVCALHFVPRHGEYWDGSGTKRLRFLFEAAKALVTGEPPVDVAKHGEVVMADR